MCSFAFSSILYQKPVVFNRRFRRKEPVTAPAGKQFSGWITGTGAGETVRTLILRPDETGKASLPAGNRLAPMTLLPLFEQDESELYNVCLL